MKLATVISIALAILVTGVFSPGIMYASSGAIVVLESSAQMIETGEQFEVSIQINPSGEEIDTARITLNYPSGQLEVISSELGSLFPSLSPKYEVDNREGMITFGGYKLGDPVSNSGTFGVVTMRALTSGTAEIILAEDTVLIRDGVSVFDGDTQTIELTIEGEPVSPIDVTESFPTTPLTEPLVSEEKQQEMNLAREQEALVYFGAFYGRMPQNGTDWSALHCIAYGGCAPSVQDVEAEQAALVIFGQKYAKMPSSGMEWSVIHTLAYTSYLTHAPPSTN